MWCFKGHANSRARIYFEKLEIESKEARSEMSTEGTHSPVANFFSSPVSVTQFSNVQKTSIVLQS